MLIFSGAAFKLGSLSPMKIQTAVYFNFMHMEGCASISRVTGDLVPVRGGWIQTLKIPLLSLNSWEAELLKYGRDILYFKNTMTIRKWSGRLVCTGLQRTLCVVNRSHLVCLPCMCACVHSGAWALLIDWLGRVLQNTEARLAQILRFFPHAEKCMIRPQLTSLKSPVEQTGNGSICCPVWSCGAAHCLVLDTPNRPSIMRPFQQCHQ